MPYGKGTCGDANRRKGRGYIDGLIDTWIGRSSTLTRGYQMAADVNILTGLFWVALIEKNWPHYGGRERYYVLLSMVCVLGGGGGWAEYSYKQRLV